jgi:DNA-binding GntR family transcriptional regulator
VEAEAPVRLSDNKVRERSAGVDRETKAAFTQDAIPPNCQSVRACYAVSGTRTIVRNGTYLRANWAFHSGIYRAARSQLLLSLIEPTWMRIGLYVRSMLPDRESLTGSLGNHVRVLDALRRRDPAVARQAISQDICDSAEGLAKGLRARDGQKSGDDSATEKRSPSRRPSKRPRGSP